MGRSLGCGNLGKERHFGSPELRCHHGMKMGPVRMLYYYYMAKPPERYYQLSFSPLCSTHKHHVMISSSSSHIFNRQSPFLLDIALSSVYTYMYSINWIDR